ncbi:MAG TPA: peptide MFS transporter [Gemmataceae bacterium]|nr:peptide MFS transporter [Gemmataceae bacterium]
MSTSVLGRAGPPQRTFLGHPLGLYVLFFSEMWERFSYYGMRALLMLYMINYFKWTQKDASTVYKLYTSFVFVTPILGGYLADRYLGNKIAVIIGALLMAAGQFALAFEEYHIFFMALIFLIFGNGMFKPNMSTQVGRLYPIGDGRRDGAYTIFYMGINLGAGISPFLCGWLAENTRGGYHTGFTMAGIGMILGLVVYLLGQPLIHEIIADPRTVSTKPKRPMTPSDAIQTEHAPATRALEAPSTAIALTPINKPLTEAGAERTPSVLGSLSPLVPPALLVLALILMAAAPALWGMDLLNQWNAIMLGIAGFCLMLFAYVCGQAGGGLRDRVLAILILGLFVTFFWAAFEQAGNVFTLWADKSSNRYLTQPPPKPSLKAAETKHMEEAPSTEVEPEPESVLERYRTMFLPKSRPAGKPKQTLGQWIRGTLNPVPTAWFQSINAVAIIIIAPFFAWMWVALDSRGWQPSIPMKMVLGLVFMSLAMTIMAGAANRENRSASMPLQGDRLPIPLTAVDGKIGQEKNGQVVLFHAGRLTFDPGTRTIHISGVLTDNEANLLIESTAPPDYSKKIDELWKESAKIDGKQVRSVAVQLEETPPGFDMSWSGLDSSVVRYNASTQTLIARKRMADKEVKALLVAGGDPQFRATVEQLYAASNRYRVSSWWLFWTYILATLGELCLSPVGLSMVSKLAPAKFATMLMGVWMLTNAFGSFIAGTLGEIWGTIPPVPFFLLSTAVVAASALVLLVLVRLVGRAMHGVK